MSLGNPEDKKDWRGLDSFASMHERSVCHLLAAHSGRSERLHSPMGRILWGRRLLRREYACGDDGSVHVMSSEQ